MTLYSPYSGRLADIMDSVYSLANDIKSGTTGTDRFTSPAELLSWIGRCQEDIANAGYFKGSTIIDMVASQTEYNLLTLIPRLVKAEQVRKTTASDYLLSVRDQAGYAMGKQYASTWETGKIGYLRGTKFNLIDAPSATTTDALEVFHSYYPPYVITLSQVAVTNVETGTKVRFAAVGNELEVGDYVMFYGSTNYSGRKLITAVTADTFTITQTYVAENIGAAVTCHCEPRIPLTNDIVFVYFCLMWRAMKDASRPVSPKAFVHWSQLYEKEKNRLLSHGAPPIIRARSSR